METTAYMYFQQEVMRWLVEAIDKSPINRIVNLRDQTLNQQYAIAGSTHYGLDTIDLSAASDRVHIDLVRGVFPSKMLYYLLGSRCSWVILPNGKVVTMSKFAPMGSATCFPVQCILFSGIVMLAYIMQHRSCTLSDLYDLKDELPKIMGRLFRQLNWNPSWYDSRLIGPRVYGDDIVCDSRVTDNVTYLLERFGLRVNIAKSFKGGQSVRESCGIYAYNGEDITPMLLRLRSGGTGVKDPGFFASLIEAVNTAGDHGFRGVQSMLINFMKRKYRPLLVRTKRHEAAELPFSFDRNVFGIWTKQKLQPTSVRENADWQIQEEHSLRISVKDKGSYEHESYDYDQWMRSKLHGGSSENSGTSITLDQNGNVKVSDPGGFPRHMRLARGWIPLRM
jgi:hypothetical protein